MESGARQRWGYLESLKLAAVPAPESLHRLTFGVPKWGNLESLHRLTSGQCFNQPITGVVWPASLQHLSFGERFNQPIARVVWPAGLKQPSFRRCSNQPFARVPCLHRQSWYACGRPP